MSRADTKTERDAAALRTRRLMTEQLIEYPDVWEAIGDYARRRAAASVPGSVECSVMRRLDAVAPDVAGLL